MFVLMELYYAYKNLSSRTPDIAKINYNSCGPAHLLFELLVQNPAAPTLRLNHDNIFHIYLIGMFTGEPTMDLSVIMKFFS